jgi:SPP1 family holin
MTAVRTILLVLSWANTFLVSKGYNQLPVIGEEEVTLIVTLIISLWAWWKNNSVTREARQADAYLKDLKNK